MSEKQIRECVSWGMILTSIGSFILAYKLRQDSELIKKKYQARKEELETWYDETLMDSLS